jgi:hypothetical protein
MAAFVAGVMILLLVGADGVVDIFSPDLVGLRVSSGGNKAMGGAG